MATNVLKVGGIIFRSPQGFECLKNIIINTSKPAFLVISAIDKTSRNLRNCLNIAANSEYRIAIQTLEDIIEIHLALAKEILTLENLQSYKKFLFIKHSSISEILKGVNLIADYSPRIADKVISEGENLALELIYFYLYQNNYSIKKTLSEYHIITNSKHNFATPYKDFSIKKIRETLLNFSTDIFMIQGFTGISTDNKITTMGFESSNLTACLVAAASDANELVIWTDVAGIFSIDPKLAASKKHDNISIEDARILANEGLKLIYKPMLDYAEEFGFNISIKNAFDSEQTGTIISQNAPKINNPFLIMDSNYNYEETFKLNLCFISTSQSIKLLQDLETLSIIPHKFEFVDNILYLYFDKHKYDSNLLIKNISKILF